MRGCRAGRSRVARRHDEVFELCGLEAIEVGEIADELLLDQLIDERLAQALDVHRRAGREVFETPANDGRA